jgi:hypothetical protein
VTGGGPTQASTEPDAARGWSQSLRDGAGQSAASVTATPVFIEEAFARDAGEATQRYRNPWWQTARTPRQGFILGGCYILLGLAYLSLALVTGLPSWEAAMIIFVGLGTVQIASAAVLYRHEHSPPQTAGPPKAPEP